ncbi:T9SS type A sorting domain-containing protein [Spirosoma linguale]
MFSKRLLSTLLTLGSLYSAQAQDPGVGGFIVSTPLATNAAGTVKVNVLNGSSTPIPQANNATWTINLPPNIGVTGNSISPTAANITTTVGTYSPVTGTIVTLVSNLGAVPGNANYTLTLNVIGVAPGTDAPISINAASSPPVGTNISGNDNASTTITVTGPLPVGLVTFTAQAQPNKSVSLAWTTAWETSNKGFRIERSKDLMTFETVGEVTEVAPASNGLTKYHLTDLTPFMGSSYYRLTQTDLSGKATVYPAISVVIREEAYGVFPNPVVSEGSFMLRLDEPQTAILGFYSSQGCALPLQKTGFQAGNLLLKTNSPLPAGIYLLTVQERGQTRQHRLVVQ